MNTSSLRHRRQAFKALLLIAIINSLKVDGQDADEGDFCQSFDNTFDLDNPPPGKRCLSTLFDPRYSKQFDVCKTNVCFIFKWEAPMIVFNRSLTVESGNIQYHLPFKCGRPSRWHSSLTGTALEILSKTSAREEFCVWAGDPSDCTWNGLVHFTDAMAYRGYQFTIIGPMLETPGRMCKHFTSTPYLDNPMVVIGRNTVPKASVGEQIRQITAPFSAGSWVVLGTVVLLLIFLSIFIVYTFHGSGPQSLITAYLVLVGDQEQALEYRRFNAMHHEEEEEEEEAWNEEEAVLPTESLSSISISKYADRERKGPYRYRHSRSISYRQSYFCTTSLCRMSFLSFLAMFFLFYEAAVVQSLFQQQRAAITKSVKSLSEEDLRHFAVMKDSALEDIWHSTVDPHFTKWTDKTKFPWMRCPKTEDCIRWLLSGSHDVKFIVTYEIEGSFLVHQLSDCEALTITETKESLHHFNSGWLHNWRVDMEKRRRFDRELVLLRIDGTIRKYSEELEDEQCAPITIFDIGPFILLIPILLLVMPPLCLSVLILYC